MSQTRPFPLVVRSIVLSWQSTSTLSLVSLRSISMTSTPIAITDSMASIEFSGQLRQSPRCETTTTFFDVWIVQFGQNPVRAAAGGRFGFATRTSRGVPPRRIISANFSFSIVFFKFDKRRKACRGARPSADMRIIPVPDRCPNPPICGRPSSVWPEASRPASTHRFRLRRSAPP